MDAAITTHHVALFTDQVFLPSLAVASPFDRENFGASAPADVERFRNDQGHVYPHAGIVHHHYLQALVHHMHQCIQQDEALSCFKSFFFDTWCRGIKTEFHGTLQQSISDIHWPTIDPLNSFIDYAMEILPVSDTPLMGLPVGNVSGAVASDGPRGNLVHQFLASPTLHSRPVYRYVFYFLSHIHLTSYYSKDPFIHFAALGGCAGYISSPTPLNDFQCVSIQVYGKYKTPFYMYKSGKDRHGISVTADALYQNKWKGFQASLILTLHCFIILSITHIALLYYTVLL